ncbi:MAG TPA: ABC transporter, partial [Clostridiaceae bacterium]|nr:ABC transporter [Clostridiaceae bacterium]
MIEVQNVSKRYGQHVALDNVSFTIKDGEVLGFLGPNGAG